MSVINEKLQSSTLTVLLADDDPDIREIVGSLLEMSGYKVRPVEDGARARDAVLQELPDIAVLDLTMPGCNGREVCKAIRAQPGGEAVVIMMLTARDDLQDKIDSFSEGADDYVTKPFNHKELIARVRALDRIRRLNLVLVEKNKALAEMQSRLLEQERKLAIEQTVATTAHNLGQPLAAILLNLHLIDDMPKEDERFKRALAAIQSDIKRMRELLDQLKRLDPGKIESYHPSTDLLELPKKS